VNTIAKCVALALLPLMLGTTGSQAVDESGHFAVLGLGAHSCGRFLSEAKSDLDYATYQTWLTGYLTGINLETPGLVNILSQTDLAGAMGWINNYCQQHPTGSFSDAAQGLVTFLQGK
jgi:hypothetical protein